MNSICQVALLLVVLSSSLSAQIVLEDWKFKTGDDYQWVDPDFDDSDWATIKGNTAYENQGYDGYNGYSWYRVHFDLPSSLKEASFLQDSLYLMLAKIDDIDATYFNGEKIGQTGSFPDAPEGMQGFYDVTRRYVLSADDPTIKWDAENVIAIRVYDGGGGGGLWALTPQVGIVDIIDSLQLNINVDGFDFSTPGSIKKTVEVDNDYSEDVKGSLKISIGQAATSTTKSVGVEMKGKSNFRHVFEFPNLENAQVTYTFVEATTGKSLMASQMTPYILTPKEKPEPKITNATVYGASPGRVFSWTVRATGERPMTFSAAGLPPGLSIDAKTGVITGTAPKKAATYQVTLTAANKLGKATKQVEIKLGDQLALTPPMGWNSWNCWGMAVSQERVKSSADALISSGLANHGWTYMVIDDGWQGERNKEGQIMTNEKFPEMSALADYLHDNGLKFGIYSSPGDISCGGLAGSLGHEQRDAQTYADWGVDYLKYDWCSYNNYLGTPQKSWSVAEQVLPFRKMTDALDATDRDIIHSVCNWGMNQVWEWAPQTGGQLWRTSGDIEDSWASLSTIGFAQGKLNSFSKPGGWNDPDMLIVGWVGWGDKLHETKLTPSEQYTHITLWSMAAAPLMIGCDLSKLDAFTYNLLANDEVIAINQDALGQQATVVYADERMQVWKRPLADGGEAIALFNLDDEKRSLATDWQKWGLTSSMDARDAWRQIDLGSLGELEEVVLEPHGTILLKLSAAKR
ncbi:MAG: putative Ig domain-containing protein [Bacteroidota bacterium]